MKEVKKEDEGDERLKEIKKCDNLCRIKGRHYEAYCLMLLTVNIGKEIRREVKGR